jgi:uncharacterized repeat protein (TIGR01451 family)
VKMFKLNKKGQKALNKSFALISIFSLVLQSLSGIFFLTPAYSQETPTPLLLTEPVAEWGTPTVTPDPQPETITPTETPVIVEVTPEPTAIPTEAIIPTDLTPIPTEEILPTVTPEVLSTETVTPTPETLANPPPQTVDLNIPQTSVGSAELLETIPLVVEKECLTDQSISDSKSEDWNIDLNNGTAETKEKIKLGVRYLFPLENKVSVSFKCLPKDEALRTSLKIQQVKVSDLKLPEGTNPYGEYAYDITTGMTDGTFEYEMTLPKPENQSVAVAYTEDINSEMQTIGEGNSNQEGDKIKINSLDHFTIFIATYGGTSYVVGTEKIQYSRGETVYAYANELTNSNNIYYKLEIINQNGTSVVDSGCHRQISSEDISYPIVNTDPIGINWKAIVRESTGTNQNNARDKCNNNQGTITESIFEVKASTIPTGVTNPTLSAACGLDIALVLDNSTSIDETELTAMKNAMIAFTTALSGTPTQFSVTKFATTANVAQTFTSNITNVNNAINAIPVGGGSTNWQDGLTKAQSTFDPRPVTNPNLIIFASDGNPNRTGASGSSATESVAVADAVIVANAIKTGGTRIIALGIGTDLNTVNMQAISGPVIGTNLSADVITTDFATLASALATFASDTCGRTITVTKLIDADGNLGTTGDQVPASGWTFDIGGQTGKVTDASGKTPAVTLPVGSGYNVIETQQAGYSLLKASCTGATNNGSEDLVNKKVSGIQIASGNVISCTFINTQNQTDISVSKIGSPNPVNNGGTLTYTLTVNNLTAVPAANVIVTDTLPAGFTPTSVTFSQGSCSDTTIVDDLDIVCELGTLASLATATVTIVGTITVPASVTVFYNDVTVTTDTPETNSGNNSDNEETIINHMGTLRIVKNAIGGNDTFTYHISSCSFDILGPTLCVPTAGQELPITYITTIGGTNYVDISVNEGQYSIGELELDGWASTSTTCGTEGAYVTAGQTKTCTFTNSKLPTLTVNKVVNSIDPNESGKFNLKIDGITYATDVGNGGTTGAREVSIGSHTVSETDGTNTWSGDYTRLIGGNCATDGTISLAAGENKTCTITNTRLTSNVTVSKKVDTNGDGIFEGDDVVGNTLGFRWQIGSGPWNDMGTTVKNPVNNNGYFYVNENSVSGYHFVGWYLLGSGGHSCTSPEPGGLPYRFTANSTNRSIVLCNARDTGNLIVNKVVTNNNGGTKVVANFPLFVNSSSVLSGATNKYIPGTYTVTETGDPGYSASYSGNCNSQGQVTVVAGQTKTCTITNDDIQPKLTITKVVVGSSDVPSNFDLWVTKLPWPQEGPSVEVVSGVQNGFNAGSYNIFEGGSRVGSYTAVISGNCASNGNITLNPGDVKSCTITNTRDTATLRVLKNVDLNGDGDYTDPGETNATDWQWQTRGPGNLPEYAHSGNTGDPATTVVTGNHYLSETAKPGFHQVSESCTGANYTGYSGGKFLVGITRNQNVVCTYTNARDTGTVIVHKFNDTDADGSFEPGEVRLDGWNVTLGQFTQVTENGRTTFANLPTGTYGLSEPLIPNDWRQTNIYCDNETFGVNNSNQYQVTVGVDETVNCYVGNFELGEIRACKYDDYDGDGEFDENEPGIAGVTMTLDKRLRQIFDLQLNGDFPQENWQTISVGDTGQDGCYTFTGLTQGDYRVSEDLNDLPGYSPINPQNGISNTVQINSGSSEPLNFFNHLQPITLTLGKANNVSGSMGPGGTVTYTLTVTNTSKIIAHAVSVKDILPPGFSYVLGSTTGALLEPEILGQSLTWSLGDLNSDEIVTITYQAITSSSLQEGNYPNVALAWGYNRSQQVENGSMLQVASPTFDRTITYADPSWSWVNLVPGLSLSASIGGSVLGVSTTGQVLGAATGSETYWLVLAIAMIIGGFLLINRKRFIK